jgi:hypothetical protein
VTAQVMMTLRFAMTVSSLAALILMTAISYDASKTTKLSSRTTERIAGPHGRSVSHVRLRVKLTEMLGYMGPDSRAFRARPR